VTSKLSGVVPPMTTPFDANGDIDLRAVKTQVDWCVDQGAHGLAVGGSTGEGHTLDVEEFRDLIEAAVEASAGRVPIIAGIIVDSTRDAIRRGKAVADMDVAALQVTPVHYLFRPSDDAMQEHFRVMGEETGQDILIYNVIPWSYLSPELLCKIMREVPQVVGVKQSAGDLKMLADLMLMCQPEDRIFSAVDALLYPSYALGACGSIAATLSAIPGPCVEQWDAVQAGDHVRAKALHEKILPMWNAIVADNLPACTKYAQTIQGCPGLYPRAPMPEASDDQKTAIRKALTDLGIAIS
jgi:4-hydroxy-tetrahydrodipicolinate synthase